MGGGGGWWIDNTHTHTQMSDIGFEIKRQEETIKLLYLFIRELNANEIEMVIQVAACPRMDIYALVIHSFANRRYCHPEN